MLMRILLINDHHVKMHRFRVTYQRRSRWFTSWSIVNAEYWSLALSFNRLWSRWQKSLLSTNHFIRIFGIISNWKSSPLIPCLIINIVFVFSLALSFHHQVLDGLETTSQLIGVFCGTTIPEPVRSTGNSMRIEWQSDFSVSGRGFSATYEEGKKLSRRERRREGGIKSSMV